MHLELERRRKPRTRQLIPSEQAGIERSYFNVQIKSDFRLHSFIFTLFRHFCHRPSHSIQRGYFGWSERPFVEGNYFAFENCLSVANASKP